MENQQALDLVTTDDLFAALAKRCDRFCFIGTRKIRTDSSEDWMWFRYHGGIVDALGLIQYADHEISKRVQDGLNAAEAEEDGSAF